MKVSEKVNLRHSETRKSYLALLADCTSSERLAALNYWMEVGKQVYLNRELLGF